MRFKKSIPKEDGFLLLESLLTMTILVVVMMILCPLAINWVSIHRETKNLVEESRQLYEGSLILNDQQTKQFKSMDDGIRVDKNRMKIRGNGTEVVIYETVFTK